MLFRSSTDGKLLFFISSRTFNPTYGATEWNHVYNDMENIYFVTLAKDTKSPFAPKSDETKPKVVNAVTLEVSPEEAEKLDLARSVGSLSLVLRNQVEARPVDTAGATKRSLLNEPVVQAAAPTPIARVIQIAQRIVERKPVNTNCVGVISGMHQDKECF